MTIIEYLGIALIGGGVLFDLLGCMGMVRFPDVYNRLQAGTKCVTLGVCLILAGSLILADAAPMRLKTLCCMAFILITSPTAAHALARAARNSGVRLWEHSVVDQFDRR